jgi:hypothetical protein
MLHKTQHVYIRSRHNIISRWHVSRQRLEVTIVRPEISNQSPLQQRGSVVGTTLGSTGQRWLKVCISLGLPSKEHWPLLNIQAL